MRQWVEQIDMDNNKAWGEGYKAFIKGLSYFDNPHVRISSSVAEGMAWSAGWKSAYQQDKILKGTV